MVKKVSYSKKFTEYLFIIIIRCCFNFINQYSQLEILCNWLFLVYLRNQKIFTKPVFGTVRNSIFFFWFRYLVSIYISIFEFFFIISLFSQNLFFLQFTLFLNFLPKMEFFFSSLFQKNNKNLFIYFKIYINIYIYIYNI